MLNPRPLTTLWCRNALLATPAALSELKASFARLATTPRLATSPPQGASANAPALLEDACQSCVAIISEAAAIIQVVIALCPVCCCVRCALVAATLGVGRQPSLPGSLWVG